MRDRLRLLQRIVLALAALAAGLTPVPAFGQPPSPGTVRGTVVDARSGTGLRSVAVRLQDTQVTTLTDAEGRFEIGEVAPGDHELYISVVDFVLLKRAITVRAGETLDLRIPISEGTGTYRETVTVRPVSMAIPRDEPTVAAQEVLSSSDLQQLRGLLTNDPFRAVQVLPGVASGDDFGSEFTVRGGSVLSTNFIFEGVGSPFLIHTVRDIRDSGSVAMVNGDVLDGMTLLSGSYPQRFGDRTGAELHFRMREGSRDRVQSRVSVSMTDASFVTEGPLGREKRGSWLVSMRRSYLDMLLKRLDSSDTGFGFTDAQAKLVYDVNGRHQVLFAMTAGRSKLDQTSSRLDDSDVETGTNQTAMAVLSWRYLPSRRFAVMQRAAVIANNFRNVNMSGVDLGRGRARDALYRSDWSLAAASRVLVEGGGELRWSSASKHEIAYPFGNTFLVPREEFSGSSIGASAYAQARVSAGGGRLVPGVRVDHWSLTGHTTASPWLQASWPLGPSLTIRGGTGVYRQEPGIGDVLGLRGSPTLRAARAYHVDAGLEGRLSPTARWQATLYDREDRDLVSEPNLDLRLVNGELTLGALLFPHKVLNNLDGHARGVELLLQRRTPNGLSGWVSYALGFTRYHDRTSGETFWGDFDQRHTINLFGNYRVNDRLSFSARFRAGSNYPTPGYWEARGDQYFLSERRNELRIPAYSRLDMRANRTFTWEHKRLTLFVEALNVYARKNVRPASPGIDGRTFQAFGLFDTLFPLLPSLGFLIEF